MIGEEDVARALCLIEGDDPNHALRATGEPMWRQRRSCARAAISAHLEALLNPYNRTQEMVEAGIVALGSDDDRSSAEVVFDVFDAMLRAVAPPAQNSDEVKP